MMARGRMVSRSISRDLDLSDLANEHGSDIALLFTWMIPHLDRDGRLDADPEVVKGLIVPRIRRIDSAMVAEFIRIYSGKNLVEIYETERGLRFLSFPGFTKHQSGMRYDRETPSDFPDPEQCRKVSGPTPDLLRSSSGPTPAERNGKEVEEKRKETNGKGARASVASVNLSPNNHTADIAEVFECWRGRHPNQFLMPHSGLQEWREIQARLSTDGCTVDNLQKAIDGIHLDDWEDRPRNLTLHHAMKDLASVQRFIAMAEAGPRESLDDIDLSDVDEDPWKTAMEGPK